MTGKAIVKNLIPYLESLFEIPVYPFDQNKKRELPCLIVGYNSDEQSGAGMFGHYTVDGFCAVAINGYDDEENTFTDSTAKAIAEALEDREQLAAFLNVPDDPEDDERPSKGFHLNRLFLRGSEREEQDSSTFVFIRWEAFTAAKD